MDEVRLSVIVPSLNSAATIGQALPAFGGAQELLVVDGGSRDDTCAIARAHGASVVESARGRGFQLAEGARAANGEWLLFLHADTVLAPDWRVAVASFIGAPGAPGRPGAFRFALDDAAWQARVLERLVRFRSRAFGLMETKAC